MQCAPTAATAAHPSCAGSVLVEPRVGAAAAASTCTIVPAPAAVKKLYAIFPVHLTARTAIAVKAHRWHGNGRRRERGHCRLLHWSCTTSTATYTHSSLQGSVEAARVGRDALRGIVECAMCMTQPLTGGVHALQARAERHETARVRVRGKLSDHTRARGGSASQALRASAVRARESPRRPLARAALRSLPSASPRQPRARYEPCASWRAVGPKRRLVAPRLEITKQEVRLQQRHTHPHRERIDARTPERTTRAKLRVSGRSHCAQVGTPTTEV